MKKLIYLSTCDTCRKIMKAVKLSDDFEHHDLKDNPIDGKTLKYLHSKVDSYKDLLNKRSRKYQTMGLKDLNLSETELKDYILKEYTFLKRPIFIVKDEVFIGNSKKVVEELKLTLGEA